jgi:uncharacterized integral membrane protein
MDEQAPGPQPEHTPAPPVRRRGAATARWLRLLVGAAALVYLILFVSLNTRKVRVDFVFGSTRLRLIWAILLAGVVGFLIGMLLPHVYRLRRWRRRPRP